MPTDDDTEHPSGSISLGTLKYPEHIFNPESLLNFTELKGFQQDWKQLGLDVEYDLWCLQAEIMMHPKMGDVIPGTGSLRKLRFSPPSWTCGKRSGLRVLYVYFEEIGHVLLVIAYQKGRHGELTPAERRTIKRLIEEEQRILRDKCFG